MRQFFTKDIKKAVIKVGTSILTKDGRFDKKIVGELAAEISALLKKGIRVYIVSSGAIGAAEREVTRNSISGFLAGLPGI